MPAEPGASLDLRLEPAVDQLIQDACEGGNAYLRRFDTLDELGADESHIREYIAAVHRGFDRAQDEVLERLLAIQKAGQVSASMRGEEFLLRKVMDAIAWQMIERELYVARRLFRDEVQPSLATSNATSVVEVAKSLSGSTFDRFGLMTDLTSFVQIGDILASRNDIAKLEIIEVKEGHVNHKVLQFSDSYEASKSAEALDAFRNAEGEKVFAQFRRVQRQKERAASVANILNNDQGYDPSTETHIIVSTPSQPIDLFDDRLGHVIAESHQSGWAIDVIDDCVYLGAYRGHLRGPAHSMFATWFQTVAAHPALPAVDFAASLINPLALPPFARFLTRDQSLDVIFGRCRVLMGVDLGKFVDLVREAGATVRFATRKEKARFTRGGERPLNLDGRVLMVERNGGVSALYDGVLLRMLFHGQAPHSVAAMSASIRPHHEKD